MPKAGPYISPIEIEGIDLIKIENNEITIVLDFYVYQVVS